MSRRMADAIGRDGQQRRTGAPVATDMVASSHVSGSDLWRNQSTRTRVVPYPRASGCSTVGGRSRKIGGSGDKSCALDHRRMRSAAATAHATRQRAAAKAQALPACTCEQCPLRAASRHHFLDEADPTTQRRRRRRGRELSRAACAAHAGHAKICLALVVAGFGPPAHPRCMRRHARACVAVRYTPRRIRSAILLALHATLEREREMACMAHTSG